MNAVPVAVAPATVPPAAPSTTPTRLPAAVAARWVARPDLWRPHVAFTEPRHTVRLCARDGWEAWLLTWLSGQSTGLHDHGGSAGAFAVLEGALAETVLVPVGPGGQVTARQVVLGVGQVRAFGAHHVHDVTAAGARAVSLHVYSPALTSMTRFALTEGRLVTTSRERAGVDW